MNAEIARVVVTPDYFRTIGTPLRRGRHLDDGDHADSARVALINESAVRRWFPAQDPLGRRVITNGVSTEIVGIVADITQRSAADPVIPMLFVPIAQRSTRMIRTVARTTADPAAVASAIPALIRALDADLVVADVGPATHLVDRSLARPRFYTGLLGVFAGVALTMAASGIFGVMNYAVVQRTREIGIRMAFGAPRAEVVGAVVRRTVTLALIGSCAGLVLATQLSGVLQDQLFGVTRLDPLTFAVALAVLVLSACLAAFLPALRAATVDPAMALRE
jgi:putative ABC transport system permease protein